MRKINSFFTLLFLVCLVFTFGCKTQVSNEEVLEKEIAMGFQEGETEVYYRFPTPEEMFRFIKKGKIDYNTDLLNSTKNSKKYLDTKSKALNLGVYTSDLAYTTLAEKSTEASIIFETIYALTIDLSISSALEDGLVRRIKNNLDDVDSLLIISRESYFDIIDYLVDNEREMTLSIISVGAYIEAFYIALNSIDEYEESSTEIQRIAEQKYAFENLVFFLYRFKENQNIEKVIGYVDQIIAVFDQFKKENISKSTSLKSEGGQLLFQGGSKIIITEDQFYKLKEIINEIRKEIVEG